MAPARGGKTKRAGSETPVFQVFQRNRSAKLEARRIQCTIPVFRASSFELRASPELFFKLLLAICLAGSTTLGQGFEWGGSLRYYQFFRAQNPAIPSFLLPRRDSEFASLRFKFEGEINPSVRFEAQPVLDILSPPASSSQILVVGGRSDWLSLEDTWNSQGRAEFTGRLDRLVLTLDIDRLRVEVGRQAITWGVTYFWPAMDLFSNFAPQLVDREYKPGVDAVRATVAIGRYSELQLVGAVLGPSFEEDKTAAALLRLHLGRLDLGLMGGSFHGDRVGGLFATTDWKGTALRGEFTYTRSDEPGDRLLDRESFWRASLGIDRQVHPDWTLTLEWAYNGFGVSDANRYSVLLLTDRVQRGELNALGKQYLGGNSSWQLHPLWTLSQALLVNLQDPSVLWIPTLQWSSSNDSTVLFGYQQGFGGGLNPDLSLESEYGAVPATLFASVRVYF